MSKRFDLDTQGGVERLLRPRVAARSVEGRNEGGE